MAYLEREDIILINRMTIDRYGGNFVPQKNHLNQNGFDCGIEAVEGEMYGQEIFSKIFEKAAVCMFSIISNHVLGIIGQD